MKHKYLSRGLYILGIGAVIAVLAACPNPVNSDLPLEEGDGVFEIAHYGGRNTPVESEFFPSSKYLKHALRDFFGWTFTPTAKSEDGRLVVGNAVNESGYSHGDLRVEPGTKAAVYWVVGESHRRRDPFISLPQVIGLVDPDSLEGGWRARWRMMWKLNSQFGLLYLDQYSIYLETASSVTDLEARHSYDVAGTIGSANYVANFKRLKVEAITASLSDANEIISFVFAAADNPFDQDVVALIDGYAITATVPIGPDYHITPTVTIPEAASITPASGIAQDFSVPVLYTVTAESGLEAVYTVTVTFEPPSNDPPAVSFPNADFLITGDPDGVVNGEYVFTGTARRYFNGAYYLFQMTYNPGTGNEYYWVIYPTTSISSPFDAVYLHQTSKFLSPPPDGWMPGTGSDGTNLRVYGVPVTSDIQYFASPPYSPVPATLTAVYYYADPEGQADASTFQWYELTDPATAEFSPIDGAISRSYTLTGLEGGEIRVEITARDSLGAVGNTVLSRRVIVGGG